MILSRQEPTEIQITKLKLKLFRKNQKCILVIALNPKILYMRFLTAQLNRTLMKTNSGLYIEGVGVKEVVCKTGWAGEGVVLHV